MENHGNSFVADAMVIIQDSDEFMNDLLSAIDKKLESKTVAAKPVDEDEILNAKQTCEMLHISAKKFQSLRKERRIKYSQVGRKIYVRRSEIDRYLESHSINNK